MHHNFPSENSLQTFLKNLPNKPGVYQMYDDKGEVLYIGKAQSLKKRVKSYFQRETTNSRIASLVSHIRDIKVIVTASDSEALLLENNLIKEFLPRYNILFRDDKSYPYIYLSKHQNFPRMDFYRGMKKDDGNYFGPYPSSTSVRESLNFLQKVFKIRQCSDTFFQNRTRPCIQYQINRCTAPCVNLVSEDDYQRQVKLAKLFLQGKNTVVLHELMKQMEQASNTLRFEEAARLRDQIAHLRKMQEKQYVFHDGDDVDVLAFERKHNVVCVSVLYFRNGSLLGNKNYFPKSPMEISDEEIISSIITQYYLSPHHCEDIPKQILLPLKISESDWIESVLAEKAGHKVKISQAQRGDKLRWLQMAKHNAEIALQSHILNVHRVLQQFESLQKDLQINHLPERLECFDVSHMQGEATIASCVVFNEKGADKKSYRRFNITNVTKGDDYGALKQALSRRYSRLKNDGDHFPDIVIIDGGKGQLHQAEMVFEELQITDVILMAIAKGPTRKAGFETIFLSGQIKPITYSLSDDTLHLIQHIRDEAHRFAITGHKQKRNKRRVTSPLEEISGIGGERRKQLLHYFGGLQELQRASEEEIAKVSGISRALAKRIYEYLHKQ